MWPFKRKRIESHQTTSAEVMKQLTDLTLRVRQLEEEVKANHLHHLKLRGRVYEALGKAPDERSPTNLSDPRLTKEQLRAALHIRRATRN